jgi:hypothetical protein
MRVELFLEFFYTTKNVLIVSTKLVLALFLIAINFLRPD